MTRNDPWVVIPVALNLLFFVPTFLGQIYLTITAIENPPPDIGAAFIGSLVYLGWCLTGYGLSWTFGLFAAGFCRRALWLLSAEVLAAVFTFAGMQVAFYWS